MLSDSCSGARGDMGDDTLKEIDPDQGTLRRTGLASPRGRPAASMRIAVPAQRRHAPAFPGSLGRNSSTIDEADHITVTDKLE